MEVVSSMKVVLLNQFRCRGVSVPTHVQFNNCSVPQESQEQQKCGSFICSKVGRVCLWHGTRIIILGSRAGMAFAPDPPARWEMQAAGSELFSFWNLSPFSHAY